MDVDVTRDGLGEAYDGDLAFASALETFGGGHDDPISVAVGGYVPFWDADSCSPLVGNHLSSTKNVRATPCRSCYDQVYHCSPRNWHVQRSSPVAGIRDCPSDNM